MQSDIVILILTYNEQENIEQCLNSISGWAAKTYVIDSGSTDGTLEKVRQFDVEIKYNKFVNFSKQRNFALGLLEKDFDGWVLFLDADEYLTSDIKSEILDNDGAMDVYAFFEKLNNKKNRTLKSLKEKYS